MVGEEGMNALFEYGTMTEIEYVGLDIYTCCYELGYVKESEEIADLMLRLFPKVACTDTLCDKYWEEGFKWMLPQSSTLKTTWMPRLPQEKWSYHNK